jgi:hypothetical protein
MPDLDSLDQINQSHPERKKGNTMSTETDIETQEAEGQETEANETQTQETDRFHNFQKEIDRKMQKQAEAISQQIQALVESQNSLVNQIKPQEETQNLDDLYYSDPKGYAEAIKEQTKKEVMKEFTKTTEAQSQRQAAIQSTISEVTAAYPELTKADHPMTQKVYEILGPNAQNSDPKDIKLAVLQAADDLSLLPASKRKKKTMNDDEFTGLTSKGQKSPASKKGDDELEEGTRQWAKALGLNLKDPGVMARLKARSKRSNWTEWKGLNNIFDTED